MQSNEARAARLTRDAERVTRRRAEEIPHQREDRQVRDALRHQGMPFQGLISFFFIRFSCFPSVSQGLAIYDTVGLI